MKIPEDQEHLLPPPSYEEAIRDSLVQDPLEEAPEQSILYRHQVTLQQSHATFELKNGRIQSFDPLLNNPTDIFHFFLAHSQAPRCFIKMHGYHSESHTETYTDSEGNTQTRHKNVDVTDFLIRLDCSKYIAPEWSRMISEPRPNKLPLTIQQTIQEYTVNKKQLKEIHMRKQLLWNLVELESALRYCIRNTGYASTIDIKFDMEEADVSIYSPDQWNRLAHDTCCNVLCILSCLWIIFLPLYHFSRSDV